MAKEYNGKNFGNIDNFTISGKSDNNMFDLDEKAIEEYERFDADSLADDMLMSAIPMVLSQATELAKMVIENRVRNSEKMTDEDIYQIYETAMSKLSQSFQQQ